MPAHLFKAIFDAIIFATRAPDGFAAYNIELSSLIIELSCMINFLFSQKLIDMYGLLTHHIQLQKEPYTDYFFIAICGEENDK